MIDLATRMVVGWQLATHMRTRLVSNALEMALDAGWWRGRRSSIPTAAPVHLRRVRLVLPGQSRADQCRRTGVRWDNAAAESFFAALKNEMYHWP